MATLIKGLLAHNLDWQFVMVGVALAATVELCGVSSLSFAVGAYLPLSTTRPIFVGGARARPRGSGRAQARARPWSPRETELGPGNLFATGLVAGGAVAGVVIALVTVTDRRGARRRSLSIEHGADAHAGRRRLPDPGAGLLRGDGGDALARGAPASRAASSSPTPRTMVHGAISFHTKETTL